ncbi:MAG TPA: nucleotidyltransferase domain-containing protein [Candidatus Nanoarchaeia archaeon]|nr:nucleotidyltransferase domain-containing protein [Candidatus Nanoarchaeia archaeon]
MELIRPIIRVGNSAGVVLPREWLHGTAKVVLVRKPVEVVKDLFEILQGYFFDIVGIYLTGSYARGEQTEESDVDVLVITNRTNKRFVQGKYDVLLISTQELDLALQTNAIPLLPMIKEGRPVLNAALLEHFQATALTKDNLSWHIDSTRSMLAVIEEALRLDEGKGMSDDAFAYSLVLRLREAYIVDCLIAKKLWSNRELKALIKRIGGSLKAYEGYVRVKSSSVRKKGLPTLEARRLYSYIYDGIRRQEQWLQRNE